MVPVLHRSPKTGCSETDFSQRATQSGADTNTIVQYLGIAADEPIRIARHTKQGILLPLVEIGWDEAYCRQWCEENDLLSPIYTKATRGGCWFCHNSRIGALRDLRHDYPELWAIMLRWDADSPISFQSDGHTILDYDKRFAAEDAGLAPADRRFRWKMLDEIGGEYFIDYYKRFVERPPTAADDEE